MYKNAKKGWYKLLNPGKFIPPSDKFMKSFNESEMSVEYKSSLELKTLRYADYNKHIIRFSCEPFHIKYIKPLDNKEHRYFIDFFFEFANGEKFIIEVKSKGETVPPKKPRKKTQKSLLNYQRAIITYSTNTAKWKAAKVFAKKNNMKFIILTEDQLK